MRYISIYKYSTHKKKQQTYMLNSTIIYHCTLLPFGKQQAFL